MPNPVCAPDDIFWWHLVCVHRSSELLLVAGRHVCTILVSQQVMEDYILWFWLQLFSKFLLHIKGLTEQPGHCNQRQYFVGSAAILVGSILFL